MLLGEQELRDRDVREREFFYRDCKRERVFIEIARGHRAALFSAGEGILTVHIISTAHYFGGLPLYMLYVSSLSLTNLKHIE